MNGAAEQDRIVALLAGSHEELARIRQELVLAVEALTQILEHLRDAAERPAVVRSTGEMHFIRRSKAGLSWAVNPFNDVVED